MTYLIQSRKYLTPRRLSYDFRHIDEVSSFGQAVARVEEIAPNAIYMDFVHALRMRYNPETQEHYFIIEAPE